MLFQVVQIFYWLALSTWFGGVLFVALAAPVVFRTVRESNPILTDVLSVNLEGQHATLLAGSIVGELLRRMVNVELICAGVLLLASIIQPFVIDVSPGNDALSSNLTAAILRTILILAAAAIVVYGWRVTWPKLTKYRKQYIDHADEPEIANPAKELFDAEHHRSVTLMSIVLFLLLGVILFSGNITPPAHVTSAVPAASR